MRPPRSRHGTFPGQRPRDGPLTLQQEAIETSRRALYVWGQDAKLRHNPVTFISAGTNNPLEIEKPAELVPENCTPNVRSKDDQESTGQSSGDNGTESGVGDVASDAAPDMESHSQHQGDAKCLTVRPTSPAETVSSEETVLLFKGRNTRVVRDRDPFALDTITFELQEVECEMTVPAPQSASSTKGESNSSPVDETQHTTVDDMHESATTDDDNEPAGEPYKLLSDDYLENLLQGGDSMDELARFYGRDIGGTDDEMVLSQDQTAPSEIGSEDSYQYSPVTQGRRRLTKAEKKKLRAQGRFPKENKPHDLWVKYPTGMMTMPQVVEELKLFLMSTKPQTSFPPLSKDVRKMIHELANRVSLKSKSIGGGPTRRPVLYRVKATPRYTDEWFESVTARVTNRYFGKKDKGRVRKNGGARGAAPAGYRDGDVVGQGVPELGLENRGRAMLEKMGWSSGTALGTMENKGILQPVVQVVKRSKAGLG